MSSHQFVIGHGVLQWSSWKSGSSDISCFRCQPCSCNPDRSMTYLRTMFPCGFDIVMARSACTVGQNHPKSPIFRCIWNCYWHKIQVYRLLPKWKIELTEIRLLIYFSLTDYKNWLSTMSAKLKLEKSTFFGTHYPEVTQLDCVTVDEPIKLL